MPQAPQDKKLVLVLTISMLMIGTSRKAQKVRVLNEVSHIFYLVQFQKNKGKDILALLNSGT